MAWKPGKERLLRSRSPGALSLRAGPRGPGRSRICEAGVGPENSRQERLVLGFVSPLVDPGVEGPGRAGSPVETVTQEAGDLECESYGP